MALVMWAVGAGLFAWAGYDHAKQGHWWTAAVYAIADTVVTTYMGFLYFRKDSLLAFYDRLPADVGQLFSAVTRTMGSIPSSTWIVIGVFIVWNGWSRLKRTSPFPEAQGGLTRVATGGVFDPSPTPLVSVPVAGDPLGRIRVVPDVRPARGVWLLPANALPQIYADLELRYWDAVEETLIAEVTITGISGKAILCGGYKSEWRYFPQWYIKRKSCGVDCKMLPGGASAIIRLGRATMHDTMQLDIMDADDDEKHTIFEVKCDEGEPSIIRVCVRVMRRKGVDGLGRVIGYGDFTIEQSWQQGILVRELEVSDARCNWPPDEPWRDW